MKIRKEGYKRESRSIKEIIWRKKQNKITEDVKDWCWKMPEKAQRIGKGMQKALIPNYS